MWTSEREREMRRTSGWIRVRFDGCTEACGWPMLEGRQYLNHLEEIELSGDGSR